ncbi:MAG: hypothetical protein JSS89_12870 [Bacteroidetes bacterium]|nr:hypothetical protein [Bacteroidota bacterium]
MNRVWIPLSSDEQKQLDEIIAAVKRNYSQQYRWPIAERHREPDDAGMIEQTRQAA